MKNIDLDFVAPLLDFVSNRVFTATETAQEAHRMMARIEDKAARESLALTVEHCEAIERRFSDLYCFLKGDDEWLDVDAASDRNIVHFAVEAMCAANWSSALDEFTIEEIFAGVMRQLNQLNQETIR